MMRASNHDEFSKFTPEFLGLIFLLFVLSEDAMLEEEVLFSFSRLC